MKWNLENQKEHADGVLLYFYDPSMFSKKKVKDGITHYLNNLTKDDRRWYGHHNYITHVYCLVRGEKKLYRFEVQ